MFLRIEKTELFHLAGMNMKMNFKNHQPGLLWRNFMTRRNEIHNRIGNEYFSCEVYSKNHFDNFDPEKDFEKWAAVKVSNTSLLPDRMQILEIPKGEYAVFLHKGTNAEAQKTYSYIFQEWLPKSGFKPDDRPHFAVMGEKYKSDHPESEEEIWIPVKNSKI